MTVDVAVIHPAGVTGSLSLSGGQGGIAIPGIGAVYVTYRFLTRGRRLAA
jgi:hypothetical protein